MEISQETVEQIKQRVALALSGLGYVLIRLDEDWYHWDEIGDQEWAGATRALLDTTEEAIEHLRQVNDILSQFRPIRRLGRQVVLGT